MRFVVAAALLAFAALLQSVLGPTLPVVQGRPDLVLVVVIAWSMLRGSGEGAFVGFLGGMLLDSVAYTQFGINTALFGLIGYAVGLPEVNAYRGNLPYFLGVTVVATFAYHSVYFLVLQALGNLMPPLIETYTTALPAAIMNALLVPPAFLLCRRLVRALAGWTQLRL
jgi:rod shape-determining protein MreD